MGRTRLPRSRAAGACAQTHAQRTSLPSLTHYRCRQHASEGWPTERRARLLWNLPVAKHFVNQEVGLGQCGKGAAGILNSNVDSGLVGGRLATSKIIRLGVAELDVVVLSAGGEEPPEGRIR